MFIRRKRFKTCVQAIVMQCSHLLYQLKLKPMREKGTKDFSYFVHVSTLFSDQFKEDETGVLSGKCAGKIASKPDGRRPKCET